MDTAQKEYWQHRAVYKDDGRPNYEPVLFRWHWPRNVLDPRMSPLELAEFLMPHLPHIIPLMADFPEAQQELRAMLQRFLTWPQAVLDEIHTWIRTVIRGEEDDIVELCIAGNLLSPTGPKYFI